MEDSYFLQGYSGNQAGLKTRAPSFDIDKPADVSGQGR